MSSRRKKGISRRAGHCSSPTPSVMSTSLPTQTTVSKPSVKSMAAQETSSASPAIQDPYALSFSLDHDSPGVIRKYFAEHGFVIFRGIFTPFECQLTRREFELSIQTKAPKFRMDDPKTHDIGPVFNHYGMWSDPMLTSQLLENRQHPRLHRACSILAEREDWLINHDSGCFYRATAPSGMDPQPGWATAFSFPGLHLDFHPAGFEEEKTVIAKRNALRYTSVKDWMVENNLLVRSDGLQIAGVINLYPNRDQDGGFHCAGGFAANQLEPWLKEQLACHHFAKQSSDTIGSYYFEAKDKVDMKYLSRCETVRCSADEGSVILWNQMTAHGSVPNQASNRYRCAQFFKIFSRSLFEKERLTARRKALTSCFTKLKFVPSSIGRSVFGL